MNRPYLRFFPTATLLVAGWLLAAAPPPAASPSWLERLLWNAHERTERARTAYRGGQVQPAADSLETALRLDSQAPEAQFNAGTGRLAAARGDAQSLLEAAAQEAPPALRSRAQYNLGNAKLAAQDLPGAVAAFKDALRADPTYQDAKHNLEVAQRLLEQQQKQQQQQQQQQDQQGQEGEDQQQQEQQQGQDEQNQDNQEQQDEQASQPDQQSKPGEDEPQPGSESQEQQEQQGQEPPSPPQQPPPGGGEQKEKPLPQFKNVPDMTADEAAAILEAVENLEREERRQQALTASQENARGRKDW